MSVERGSLSNSSRFGSLLRLSARSEAIITPLPFLATDRLPQQKIFENEFPVSAREGCTTGAAGYLPVNGFLADLHFYALIKRSTLWAIEGA